MPDRSSPQAFIHIATYENTKDNWTDIDNEQTNNQPDALVFVTQRWYPKSRHGRGTYNDQPIGVWYHDGKWSIYNQRRKGQEEKPEPQMPIGATFNVWVQHPQSLKRVDKTSIDQNTSTEVTPNVRSRLFKPLFYIVLTLLMIWLIVGISLYLWQDVNAAHWQSLFMLRDNPLISIILLLAAVIIFLMFVEKHWERFFNWLSNLDPLTRPVQAAILLSVTFFATLFVIALMLPHMMGHSLNDWVLLLVAAIPLFALIALILINKYQSLKVGGAGFTLEVSGTMTPESDPTQTFKLPPIPIEETTIDEHLLKMKAEGMPTEARVFVVRVGGKMPLEFSALKHLVNETSTIMSIRYIVFITPTNRYLGFTTPEKFKTLLPVEGRQQITEEYLRQLDVSKLSVKKSGEKPIEESAILMAYRQMMQDNLPGIPVVDDETKFLGVLQKDKIEQVVVMQLLEKSAKKS